MPARAKQWRTGEEINLRNSAAAATGKSACYIGLCMKILADIQDGLKKRKKLSESTLVPPDYHFELDGRILHRAHYPSENLLNTSLDKFDIKLHKMDAVPFYLFFSEKPTTVAQLSSRLFACILLLLQ